MQTRLTTRMARSWWLSTPVVLFQRIISAALQRLTLSEGDYKQICCGQCVLKKMSELYKKICRPVAAASCLKMQQIWPEEMRRVSSESRLPPTQRMAEASL